MFSLLSAAAKALKLNLADPKPFLDYLDLIEKWNKTYNLTAIRDPKEMFSKHLLDSLAIAPYVKGNNILDVGSGAGLPGIPLALYYPHKQFVLLDSNGKKTRFLQHVKQKLALKNIEVIQARVEKFTSQSCFTSITARAFSSIPKLLEICQHLCCDNGQFLLMKGNYPQEELHGIIDAIFSVEVIPLQIPGLSAKRHLVQITRLQK